MKDIFTKERERERESFFNRLMSLTTLEDTKTEVNIGNYKLLLMPLVVRPVRKFQICPK